MASISFLKPYLLESEGQNVSLEDMIVDGVADVTVVGWTDGAFGSQENNGISDAFIANYNELGEMKWSDLFGEQSIDRAYSVSGVDNSIYVAGSAGTNISDSEFIAARGSFVRKYSVEGNEIWTRMILDTNESQFLHSEITSVYTRNNNEIYFAGLVTGGPNGGRDIFVGKVDGEGELLWSNYYGGSQDEFVNDIEVDGNGNIYITGYTHSLEFYGNTSSGKEDGFILKLNDSGDIAWSDLMGGKEREHIDALTLDSDGFIYLAGLTDSHMINGVENTGSSNADGFVVKMSDENDLVWTKTLGYGESDFNRVNDIYSSGKDGIYVVGDIAGSTIENSPESGSGFDAFAAKLSADDGDELWATQFGGDYFDFGEKIYQDHLGNIYIAGRTSSTEFLGQSNPSFYPASSNSFIVTLIEDDNSAPTPSPRPVPTPKPIGSAPNIFSATIRGDRLILQFDDVLSDTLPRLNKFTMKNGSRESKFIDVEVIASAGEVVLTLKKAIDSTATVTLDYFDLASDQSRGVIESRSGIDLASFSGYQINNQTTQENSLSIDDGNFEGRTITLSLNAQIGSAIPSAKRFKVKAGRRKLKIAGIDTDPSEGIITLTTKKVLDSYQSLKVTYKDLAGDQSKSVIEDKSGNDMKTVRDYEIINGGFDETPPQLLSAELDDNILTLEFDSIISNNKLSEKRFKVKANGKKLKVKSASVEDNDESFVNLVVQAKRNQTIDLESEVTLSYRDPKGDQDQHIIEDLFGNDLLSVNSFFVDIV